MSGLDEELNNEETQESSNVVNFEPEKKKRKLFHIWEVSDQESYKLKLSTQMIEMLENKYKTNIVNILMVEGMPPLSIMLTVVQAALSPWEHGMKYEKVQGIYDRYVENGGSLAELLSKVLLPTLVVSGFFPQDQAEKMMDSMELQ